MVGNRHYLKPFVWNKEGKSERVVKMGGKTCGKQEFLIYMFDEVMSIRSNRWHSLWTAVVVLNLPVTGNPRETSLGDRGGELPSLWPSLGHFGTGVPHCGSPPLYRRSPCCLKARNWIPFRGKRVHLITSTDKLSARITLWGWLTSSKIFMLSSANLHQMSWKNLLHTGSSRRLWSQSAASRASFVSTPRCSAIKDLRNRRATSPTSTFWPANVASFNAPICEKGKMKWINIS